MQAGGMYIHGRDKNYLPILVMDASVLVVLLKEDKNSVNEEIFVELFLFLVYYMKNVMFLPGQCDYWTSIANFTGLGLTTIPRKPILAFVDCC